MRKLINILLCLFLLSGCSLIKVSFDFSSITNKVNEIKNKSEKIIIPNILDMSENDAVCLLQENGFDINNISVVYTEDNDAPGCGVISVEPNVGKKVKANSNITIYINTVTKTIPEYYGYTQYDYIQKLSELGITNYSIQELISIYGSDGDIIGVSPCVGEIIDEYQEVVIFTAKNEKLNRNGYYYCSANFSITVTTPEIRIRDNPTTYGSNIIGHVYEGETYNINSYGAQLSKFDSYYWFDIGNNQWVATPEYSINYQNTNENTWLNINY